jgi:vancomycin resistance protein YoaR
MADAAAGDGRRGRLARVMVGALVAALVVTVGGGVAGARSWQGDLVAAERLLPGLSLAGTDLSGATVAEARAVATAAGAAALAVPLVLASGDRTWSVTPAELGGMHGGDAAVDALVAATREAPLRDLLAMRWFGARADRDVPVGVVVDEAAAAAHVDRIADELDRAVTDAGLAWVDGALAVRAHEPGVAVDRAAATAALVEALASGAATMDLPVTTTPQAIAAEVVEAALPQLSAPLAALLDRPLTVSHGAWSRTVTPRELGAVPDLVALDAALRTSGLLGTPVATTTSAGAPDVPVPDGPGIAPDGTVSDAGSLALGPDVLDPDPAAVAGFLDAAAAELDVAARRARLDWSSGAVVVHREQAGQHVDRDAATAALAEAIRRGDDELELPMVGVLPTVTGAAYRHVLHVQQDARTLDLYVDGVRTRRWRVAIGAPGHRTPTGVFTVGDKRPAPTWHNPSPNGWGADMPLVIPPGPSNPLGLRALNWRKDGRETLIRFHGTAASSSIGQAASKGCIRLTNSDIVELYDLVPTGATIIST